MKSMRKPTKPQQHGRTRPTRVLLLLALLLLAAPTCLLGIGSRIPNQDAEGIGRGNAFAATADNPSAIYYNPAGITQLEGQNVQIGSLFYLDVQADYISPSGEHLHNNSKTIAAPQLNYAFTPDNLPFSFGL